MKYLIKWKMIVVVIIIIFILSTVKVFGAEGKPVYVGNKTRPLPVIINPIQDPSVKYCKDLGYEWSLAEGGTRGICKFPDGSSASDWDFLEGKAGEKWSYCEQKGYVLKTLSNNSKCISALNPDCSICVLKNGTEVEATLLMKSEGFVAKKCGNGICEVGESNDNCPQDCPKAERIDIIYIIAFSIIVIIIVLYIVIKRGKFKTKEKYQYYYNKEIQ